VNFTGIFNFDIHVPLLCCRKTLHASRFRVQLIFCRQVLRQKTLEVFVGMNKRKAKNRRKSTLRFTQIVIDNT